MEYVILEVDFWLSLGRLYIHGLNEGLGRHTGREGKTECSLCENEYENVSHLFWECSSTRASFTKKLQELLKVEYEDFESLDNVEKSSYVL